MVPLGGTLTLTDADSRGTTAAVEFPETRGETDAADD
jgi:hypothetical protein